MSIIFRQFNHYVEAEGIKNQLALHPIKIDETYLLGLFLVGAYQETLGDMHNLFGNTHAINVVYQTDGSYQLCNPEYVANMLEYVHFDIETLRQHYRQRLTDKVATVEQREHYLQLLLASLPTYTYLT